jgi:sulfoxide reductase catalytic subunit YedY
MWIKRKRGWELPERAATPEHVFRDRRRFMAGAAAGSLVAVSGAGAFWPHRSRAQMGPPEGDPTTGLYPVPRNDAYALSRPITEEKLAATYNNYYEFGSSKTIWRDAQRLPIRPWTVTLDGLVEKEREVDIDQLIKAMPLEERLYRHRCVEAWSMAVPWSGFPLKALVDYAEPLSDAKYVRFETFQMPDVARGQRGSWYPWPYVEGLTMAEATNELAFMVTGMYGKPVPKQNGSPLRLAVPWKYGFKSIKGITRISFVKEMPKTFWWDVAADEYGFWANVNPEVDHPRWSQASERVIGEDRRIPTQPFNGYGEQVAHLYGDKLKKEYGDRLYR